MPADPADPVDSATSLPQGPERLTGRLVLVNRSPGSKSERVAPLLEVQGGAAAGEGGPLRVVLRRQGANPFHDPELEALQGQVLIVEGEDRGSHFLVRRYRVQGDDEPSGPGDDSA